MNINEAILTVLYSLLTFFSVLFADIAFGQETYEIFESDQFGYTDPFPDKTIERRGNTIEVYEHDSLGVRDIFPSERVEIRREPTLPQPRIDPNLLPQGSLILQHEEKE